MLAFLFAGAGAFAQADSAVPADLLETHQNATGRDKNTPSIGTIALDPPLSITNFAPYTINAEINPNGADIISVTVFVTPQNGDESEGNWDFYVDGNPDPSPNSTFSYTMTTTSSPGDKGNTEDVRTGTVTWNYDLLLPDDIYPEIFFADFEITALDAITAKFGNLIEILQVTSY